VGELRLIRAFFVLLAATVVVMAGLCAFMPVNDVVRIARGELLDDRPRTVYRAPFDVRVDSTFVGEGDQVHRGQLLLVLANAAVTGELTQAVAERAALLEEATIVARQIDNAAERIAALEQQVAAGEERLRVTAGDAHGAESFLATQVRHAAERLELARAGHDRSKTLLDRGMLVAPEYEVARRALVDAQAGVDEARRRLAEQRTTRARLRSEDRGDLARLHADLLATGAARLALMERAQRLGREIEKQTAVVASRREAADRRRVVAETDGTVRYVFDTKAKSDFIPAGTVLVDVAPPADDGARVYAKLVPAQAAVRRLRVGQRVHLKLEAYYYYRYGPLRGTVRYVSPPDDSSAFYVLVDLDVRPTFAVRPGYTVRGEVIVDRMRLYAFLARKLLNTLDA
jgi:multidrug resistance efflux pump